MEGLRFSIIADAVIEGLLQLLTTGLGPSRNPAPSAVAAGFWGAPVAEGTLPTVDGGGASPTSAIEASSAVAATKVGGSV
jgi:hypothetical protein